LIVGTAGVALSEIENLWDVEVSDGKRLVVRVL